MQRKIPPLSELIALAVSLFLTLLIKAVMRFFPPTTIIHLSTILKKTARNNAPEQTQALSIYKKWHRAIVRIRRVCGIQLTCLTEALVLRTTLGFSGIKSTIQLGINPMHNPMVAHAWLEVPGLELSGEDAGQYTAFTTNPL